MAEVLYALAFLVLAGLGLALIPYGFCIYRRERAFLKNAVPVQIKVGEVRVEEDEEGIRIASPVFEIINGPHAGKTRQSQMGSWPPSAEVGEVGAGLFDPSSGRIERTSSARKLRLFAIGVVALGVASIGGAALLYTRA